ILEILDRRCNRGAKRSVDTRPEDALTRRHTPSHARISRIRRSDPRSVFAYVHDAMNTGTEVDTITSAAVPLAPPPARGHRVPFVLPAFNEEANIARAIDATVTAARRHCAVYEVLVVDDGSADRTAEVVERAACSDPAIRLLRHENNRGYGEALRTGFTEASLDYVFFTDADNQF